MRMLSEVSISTASCTDFFVVRGLDVNSQSDGNLGFSTMPHSFSTIIARAVSWWLRFFSGGLFMTVVYLPLQSRADTRARYNLCRYGNIICGLKYLHEPVLIHFI